MKKKLPEISEEESFIEFPCTFPIKVVGSNLPEFREKVCAIAKKHDPSFSEEQLKSRCSKAAKYLSLTISVYVTKRSTLDKIYQELTDCELVQWAL